jgi:hypothetical protein
MADEDADQAEDPGKRVAFHYLKSNFFRVVHADGGIGGITPKGLIHFAFYSERPAIPQVVVTGLDEHGKLTVDQQQIGREGVVRELEVDVLLEVGVARAVSQWLIERADAVEKATKLRKEGASADEIAKALEMKDVGS